MTEIILMIMALAFIIPASVVLWAVAVATIKDMIEDYKSEKRWKK